MSVSPESGPGQAGSRHSFGARARVWLLVSCCVGSLAACGSPDTGNSGDASQGSCDDGPCMTPDAGPVDFGHGGDAECGDGSCELPDACSACQSADAGMSCGSDSGLCGDAGKGCGADSGDCGDTGVCSGDAGSCADVGTSCGDGVCEGAEKCSDCATDCGPCPGYTHAALLTRRSGFAENVTGAGTDADTDSAKQAWVTNTGDSGPGSLRAALSQPDRWVRFDDSLGDAFTIALTSGPIVPAANITLDGRGKHATLRSTHIGSVFELRQNNQIFVNFEIVMASQNQHIQADCFDINGGNASPIDNVWIHHVTMSGARDKRVGISFGARVTIDWCDMHGNTGHGVLVGCQVCSRPDVSFITMHHNYMRDLPDRYPRVSDGHHAHAYNNVSENWDYYAMGAVRAGELLAENNWFAPGGDDTAIKASEGANAKGLVKATGNVLNGGTEEQNAANQVFQPPYTYVPDVADQALRDRVVAEAGWQPASYWAP